MEVRFPGGVAVEAIHAGMTIRTDQPVAAGGAGSAPSPFGLFLVSIATCADFYAGLEPAYRIKDGPLDTVGEIRMIDGMDDEFFNAIENYVTVYPIDKKINFSTAPRVVMIAAIKAAAVPAIPGQGGTRIDPVDDATAEQIVDEIIEARRTTPVIDNKKVREIAQNVDPTIQIVAGLVGLGLGSGQSEVFTVRSEGILGEASPTKRIIEAVVKKKRVGRQYVVDIATWKEL